MATKTKSKLTGVVLSQHFFSERFKQINGVISRFENEVEKAVRSVRQQSKRSSENILKIFDEVIASIGATDIKNKAFEKKDELVADIKRLSDDIVDNIKNFDLTFDTTILTKLKDNLSSTIKRIQQSEVVEYAVNKVNDGKNQIFSFLQIPSQVEIDNLSRKVVSLEKKLKVVTKHSKAA